MKNRLKMAMAAAEILYSGERFGKEEEVKQTAKGNNERARGDAERERENERHSGGEIE